MKLVTAEQMRRIDKVSIEQRGVPGAVLMERAGAAVAREVIERFEPDAVAIVAGKGNNGGDGFVAARVLHERGVTVALYCLFDPERSQGDALDAWRKLPDGVRWARVEEAHGLREELSRHDVVIDAILGTGVKGPVTGLLAEVIAEVNAARANIIAVDIPSGLMAGAEQSGGPTIRAHLTITIGLPKIGLVLLPGLAAAGIVSIADIGFPEDLTHDDGIDVNLLTVEEMRDALPPRPREGHKGVFGRVMIIGGSEGMTGAAVMAARSAVRSGAGLVYSAYPRPLGAVMETNLIEPVKIPLVGGEPWLIEEQTAEALDAAETMEAVAVGPGIGQRPATGRFIEGIIRGVRAPLVVDADALNLLGGRLDLLQERPGPTILTPHPGEAARLLGGSAAEVNQNRLGACLSLARDRGATVVLKGAQTVITDPEGQRYINPTGNTGLAKGGSGDVLTGLIAGLLAQGCSASIAAQLGVFVHGLAADLAAETISVRALTPTDVIDHLGRAFLFLEKSQSN